MKVFINWRVWIKWYSSRFHLLGMVLTGASAGVAMAYGSADSGQHAMLNTWETDAVFFLIFLGAFLGRFKQQ